ncbi:MAG: type I glutamate--ammonia ligase [Candidatus Latescibacterota bacterium]|nr:MAG: type I glutamate--ammonia ligase [Candidatus Latescibacterota bacterium]
MTKLEILKIAKKENMRFLRLMFTDIHGVNKNVEVPESQFEKALDGEILFDGSSIEGFSRIEESDMLLRPDLDTFRLFPWGEGSPARSGRLICDVAFPDGRSFPGCPRSALKRVVAEAVGLGYTMMVGPEAEFFLLESNARGEIHHATHDKAGYFDLVPVDRGEEVRRDIVQHLEKMGFEVEASHHEVAPGQHEIDFRYADAVTTADNIATFRFIVRKVSNAHGMHATFMPKPFFGVNGSGMHVHQSLFKKSVNTFYAKETPNQLSKIALWYVGGLLRHARGFVAITNPLVNSYKRLVPGYEAPTNVTWSEKNRSPLVRVPDRRGIGTRVELRCPDPSANPYLALAVMLRSGLDGIAQKLDPGPPVNKNIYQMSQRERKRHKITELPADLSEALDAMEKDPVVLEALGEHIARHYVEAKREVWREYSAQVHAWEVERYLGVY